MKQNYPSSALPFRSLLLCIPILLMAFTIGDSRSEYNVPRAAVSICTNDLDLDLDVDIIIGHLYNYTTEWSGISVLFNDNHANFQADSTYLYDHHWDILTAKIDTNDKYDIITQGTFNKNFAIAIMFNFIETPNNLQYLLLNNYPDHISLGDINGDAYDDIVFCNNLDKVWGVLYNDGSGNFSSPQYHNVSGYYPTNIDCGDLNNDGREDIVIGGKTEIFFSYPDNFQSLFLDVIADHVEVTDFDFDGDLDILGSKDLFPGNSHMLNFIENLGNENFLIHDTFLFEPACHFYFTISDFNNDTLPDLLFHPMDHNNLLVFYNTGDFTLSEPQFIPMTDYGEGTRRSACADFDGNGYNDIATIRSWGAPLPANVNILFNDGEGNFVDDPITGINIPKTNKGHTINCYPNPFTNQTNIKYAIDKKCIASLGIYNLNGKQIKTLQNNILPKGKHKTTWDGTDQNGKEVSSGIYIIRLVAGRQTQSCRLMYNK